MAQLSVLPLPACFPTTLAPAACRFPEVDWIKAVGILAVVFIHALPSGFEGSRSLADTWLGRMTRFAVPGFLASSAFLYAGSKSSRSWSAVGLRLRRLLLPYLVFSLAAWCYMKAQEVVWSVDLTGTTTLPLQLLFGSALGPYYYVFVVVYLTLATPLIARLPRRVLPWAALVAVALHFASEVRFIDLPLFWHFRSPLRHFGPFLLGWCARLGHGGLLEFLRGRRLIALRGALLAACILGGVALAVLDPFGSAVSAVEFAQAYLMVALVFFMSIDGPTPPAIISWLSNASYPIYLSHMMFVILVHQAVPFAPGAFSPLRNAAAWAAGLGNAAALVLVVRELLGEERARKWVG